MCSRPENWEWLVEVVNKESLIIDKNIVSRYD